MLKLSYCPSLTVIYGLRMSHIQKDKHELDCPLCKECETICPYRELELLLTATGVISNSSLSMDAGVGPSPNRAGKKNK